MPNHNKNKSKNHNNNNNNKNHNNNNKYIKLLYYIFITPVSHGHGQIIKGAR